MGATVVVDWPMLQLQLPSAANDNGGELGLGLEPCL
jgi:hypothetical protein